MDFVNGPEAAAESRLRKVPNRPWPSAQQLILMQNSDLEKVYLKI